MFVSFFLAFVVSLFLVNFWSSWTRSEHHVATKNRVATRSNVDLARPFLVSLAIKIESENSLGMALSNRKAAARGNPIFGSVEPCKLLEARSSSHHASGSKLGFDWAGFQRNWGGPLLGVQKANVFTAPKNEIAAVTFFAKLARL